MSSVRHVPGTLNIAMIHLDHNHRKILSWSSISPDDPSFDPAKDFLNDDNDIDQDLQPVAPLDSVPTPVDAPHPALSHASPPPSPVDGNLTSPNRDRSSSLSPAPETGTPQTQPDATSAPPSPSTRPPAPDPSKQHQPAEELRADRTSRQSTPLSELSPPPDQEDEAENTGEVDKLSTADASGRRAAADDATKGKDGAGNSAIRPRPHSDLNNPYDPNNVKILQKSAPLTTSSPQSQHSDSLLSLNPSAQGLSSIPNPAADPKVNIILDLNAELLRACMDFQLKGIPNLDPHFQQYSARLQSNLAWVAAAADQGRGNQVALPVMDPPPKIDFVNYPRIQQFYSELNRLFTKDAKEAAARRQSLPMNPLPHVPAGGAVPPSLSINTSPSPVNLKRDRPEESATEVMNKRRDTGDHKSPSMMMPPPTSIPIANAAHANSAQFAVSMTNSPSVAQRSPQLPSSGPQPGMLNMNMNDAQLAARRQVQMRGAQQVTPQLRQMSPASATSSSPGAGGPMNAVPVPGQANPSAAGMGSNPQQQQPNVQQLQQQMLSILQTPNHPFLGNMMRLVPGFQTLPVQMQVQKMMMVHAQMRQQQQQQQHHHQQHNEAHLAQGRGTMPGQMQAGQNGMMQQPFAGGAARLPPHSQQQQQAMMQGGGASMFPNAGQQSSGAGSMDHQMMNAAAGGGMGGGMSGNLNHLTPQQRQMLFMQQQNRAAAAAAAVAAGGGNPGVMGPGGFGQQGQGQGQQQQQQQHQQMAAQVQAQAQMRQQQGMIVNAGGRGAPSPIPGMQGGGAGGGGGQTNPGAGMGVAGGNDTLAALRSNPSANGGIPGIARSGRSPSDGVGATPMTPRVPGSRPTSLSQEDYQRLMIQQQQNQRAATMAGAAAGGAGAGAGGMQNQMLGQMGQMQQMGGAGGGAGVGPMNMGMGMGGMGGGGNAPGMGMGLNPGMGMNMNMNMNMGGMGMGMGGMGGMHAAGPAGWHYPNVNQGMQMNAGAVGNSGTQNMGGMGMGNMGSPHIGGTSPTPGSGQNWATQGGVGVGVGPYPFSPSPAGGQSQQQQGDLGHGSRHSSATPVPQQQQQQQGQQQQSQNQRNPSPQLDPTLSGDFDFLNWTQ